MHDCISLFSGAPPTGETVVMLVSLRALYMCKPSSRNDLVFRSSRSPTVCVDHECVGKSLSWSYIYGASKPRWRRERGQ